MLFGVWEANKLGGSRSHKASSTLSLSSLFLFCFACLLFLFSLSLDTLNLVHLLVRMVSYVSRLLLLFFISLSAGSIFYKPL
jgi:hypothetical protein